MRMTLDDKMHYDARRVGWTMSQLQLISNNFLSLLFLHWRSMQTGFPTDCSCSDLQSGRMDAYICMNNRRAKAITTDCRHSNIHRIRCAKNSSSRTHKHDDKGVSRHVDRCIVIGTIWDMAMDSGDFLFVDGHTLISPTLLPSNSIYWYFVCYSVHEILIFCMPHKCDVDECCENVRVMGTSC